MGGWFRRPDERQSQVRDDTVTFTSEAMRQPLDLAGPIVADLAIRASEDAGHIMVKVCDVAPDGQAHRIADGAAVRPASATDQVVRIALGHTGYRVRHGHRLRVELSSSAFPRYIWHPGTSGDPWVATRTQVTETVILTGPNRSRVSVMALPTSG